jgi:ketosteroid isomerase-like protein
MSQQNVEIVRRAFESWNSGEFGAFVRRFGHEDVELHIVGGLSGLVGETFAGHSGVTRFWRDIVGTLGLQIEVEAVHDVDERVAVVLAQEGRGEESGAPITLRIGQVWTFREGKVIRVDSYYTPDEALEAVGLRE